MLLDAGSLKLLNGVDRRLEAVALYAAKECDVPFAIVQGRRTQAQQDELYAQGRTKPGLIVTWTRHSKHIEGKAIDFAALLNGNLSWDTKLYPHIAEFFCDASIACRTPIIWGGRWNIPDWGHIQLAM